MIILRLKNLLIKTYKNVDNYYLKFQEFLDLQNQIHIHNTK